VMTGLARLRDVLMSDRPGKVPRPRNARGRTRRLNIPSGSLTRGAEIKLNARDFVAPSACSIAATPGSFAFSRYPQERCASMKAERNVSTELMTDPNIPLQPAEPAPLPVRMSTLVLAG
jgi:hypothetical protein